MLAFIARLIFWGTIIHVQVYGYAKQSEERSCYSRFDYDYKLLTKVVALETTDAKFEDLVSQLKQQIYDMNKRLTNQKEPLEDISGAPDGSTYTRWGRTTCNANGTHTVYSGYAAGNHYTHQGAAANHLCLTKEPLWSKFDDTTQSGALVYGAEYEFDHRDRVTFFDREITDHDAPCAVCETPRSRVLMIPGRNKCLDGWTLEYNGYLVAGDNSHAAASEFICLDANPESLPNDSGNDNGKIFYFAEARCGGSLKCPPYVNGRELTCVVCTK